MDGRQIALGTLYRQDVKKPCINYCWMTNAGYMSYVTGRDYWSDRQGVFAEYIRKCGINLIPQWYMPSEKHCRLELGQPAEQEGWAHETVDSPEGVIRQIEQLPADEELEGDYDIEAAVRRFCTNRCW